MIDKILLFLESFEDVIEVLKDVFTVIRIVRKIIGFIHFLKTIVISKKKLKNDINQKQSKEQNSLKSKRE
ncbi:hypothetical protein [Flavobacterium sp. RSSB_23]|jgi:hypothetical protein|uniref:hypothetical protein n=1 Tax=Flavobacterium sp. RSSB_23 TaxID=3447668 RepID=UPI003F2E9BB3